MTGDSVQECEAPLQIPISRRAFYGLPWACFWCGVGFVAGAAWDEALISETSLGFCFWLGDASRGIPLPLVEDHIS